MVLFFIIVILLLFILFHKKKPKTYTDEKGYKRFTDSNKLVHRWVVEKKLGRKLKPGEIVHHKNRKKGDNRPQNLWVFHNQEEHDKIHKYDSKKHGKRASYKGFN